MRAVDFACAHRRAHRRALPSRDENGPYGPSQSDLTRVPEDTPWWTSTVLQSEVDGDGHLDLVVGALLSLRTRSRAGDLGPHTELAVRVLCGGDSGELLSRVEAIEREVGTGDAAHPRLRDRLRLHLAEIQ